MNRRSFLSAGAALAALSARPAVALPADAASALAEASAHASASDRRLLIVFHASWCVYCRLFDEMLADSKAAAIVDRHFVTLHMRALERKPEMQAQELPGAEEVLARYAPKGAGLPYMAVIGKGGAEVADSIMPGGDNFGFPVTDPELAAFEAMMKAGAPDMPKGDLRYLRQVCVKLYKKS
ncbi:MAG: hypothetical protein GC155_11145 [Alphaproteobacteria bacterium]|nr:hypothetical protein [Alphaproteobacteria bacterium]